MGRCQRMLHSFPVIHPLSDDTKFPCAVCSPNIPERFSQQRALCRRSSSCDVSWKDRGSETKVGLEVVLVRSSDFQQRRLCRNLKGLFTIFLFSVGSHILNSNGVWYLVIFPGGALTGAASQGPLRRESRSHVAPRVKVPWGQNKNPKILSFGHF